MLMPPPRHQIADFYFPFQLSSTTPCLLAEDAPQPLISGKQSPTTKLRTSSTDPCTPARERGEGGGRSEGSIGGLFAQVSYKPHSPSPPRSQQAICSLSPQSLLSLCFFPTPPKKVEKKKRKNDHGAVRSIPDSGSRRCRAAAILALHPSP